MPVSRKPYRTLPDSFPPSSTVYRWFARFRDDDTWETIRSRRLRFSSRRAEGLAHQ
jgi:transposase